MKKNVRNLEKSILIHGSSGSEFFKSTKKLFENKKIRFSFTEAESSIKIDDLLNAVGEQSKTKVSEMSRIQKIEAAADKGTPSTIIFFCTRFLEFSSIEALSSTSFLANQFENVGSTLDILNGQLPSLRDVGGKIIFVGVQTSKYGSPLMASFEASQRSLKSVVDSLTQNLKDYPHLNVVHVEVTRPDIDFFELFDEQFEVTEIRKDDGQAYYFERNKLLDLIKSQYSKSKIQMTSKRLANTLLEIVGSKKAKKYYRVD